MLARNFPSFDESLTPPLPVQRATKWLRMEGMSERWCSRAMIAGVVSQLLELFLLRRQSNPPPSTSCSACYSMVRAGEVGELVHSCNNGVNGELLHCL